jgi:flagellar motor switch protein FliM
MEKILSAEELDALLSDLEGTDKKDGKAAPATAAAGGKPAATAEGDEAGAGEVKLYDFKRPERFSNLQLRTLEMLHDNFARLFSASISNQLRTVAEIQVISVVQETYQEFVNSLPTSTCISIFRMPPLEGRVVFEIHSDLVFIIIDRLFGGTGGVEIETREFTDIEVSIISKVVKQALNNLKESWRHVVPVETYLEVMESNPQFAQVVLPNEMIVAITFEVRVDDSSSTMSIGIPYMTLKSILPMLSMEQWFSQSGQESKNEDMAILRKRLERVDVPLRATLCRSRVLVQDILDLKIGQVVRFPESNTKQHAEVLVGTNRKFLASVCNLGKHRAVKIVSKLENEDR